jgi:hypothetical protein
MKVIRIDDEETKLTKRQQQKVAILKLTDNGKYIEGVGIKDNEFFLLTEGDEDEMYLSMMNGFSGNMGLNIEQTYRMLLTLIKRDEIEKKKAVLQGKEPPLW